MIRLKYSSPSKMSLTTSLSFCDCVCCSHCQSCQNWYQESRRLDLNHWYQILLHYLLYRLIFSTPHLIWTALPVLLSCLHSLQHEKTDCLWLPWILPASFNSVKYDIESKSVKEIEPTHYTHECVWKHAQRTGQLWNLVVSLRRHVMILIAWGWSFWIKNPLYGLRFGSAVTPIRRETGEFSLSFSISFPIPVPFPLYLSSTLLFHHFHVINA